MGRHLLFCIFLFSINTLGQTTYHVNNGNDSGAGSLRQAILDAGQTPGADNIVFDGNFQVNLLSEIIIDNPVTITGNGIGSTIIDGASNTRIFNVFTAATSITFSNMTLQNAKSLGLSSGSAISTSASTLTINNVRFANNTATVTDTDNSYGGAVLYSGGGNVTITSSAFENNKSLKNPSTTGSAGGGAVAVTSGTISISNTTFTNNISAGWGGAIYSSTPLTLTDCSFTGNKSSYDDGTSSFNNTGGLGGAVAALEALTLSGSISFQNNASGGGGGALYKNSTNNINTDNLTSLNVTGNKAGLGGGSNNPGGGIYTLGTLTLSAANNATITNNNALGTGGGISTTANLTLDNINPMTNNTSLTSGGAVSAGGTLTLKNVTFSNNRAGYNSETQSYGPPASGYGGGGVHVAGNLVLGGNITFQNDTVAGYGGGLFISSNTSTIDASQLTTLTISQNAALSGTFGGVTITGNGGGINTRSTLVMTAATNIFIQNNTANNQGGGIYGNSSLTNLTLTNATITNNTATGSGGGIYNAGTFLTLNTSSVSSNASNSSGGGIYVTGTINITNSTINTNTTIGNGGGIVGALGLTLTGSTLSGNTASISGGGIFTTGNLTLTDVNITDNKSSFNPNTLVFINTSGHGAGIFNNGNTLTLSGTIKILNNTAGGSGGGLYKTGTFSITNLISFTVTGNKAGKGSSSNSGFGGGIYTSAPLTLTNANNALITDNFALGNGGGIYSTGAAVSITLDNINTITNNAATVSGGAIYAQGPLLLRNMSLINNKAGYNSETKVYSWQNGGGGAVYAGHDLALEGAVIFQNDTIAGSGGAIYKNSTGTFTTLNLASFIMTNNATSGGLSSHGGGIYTTAALTLNAANNININNNLASGYGGSIHTTNVLTLTDIPSVTGNTGAYGGAFAINGGTLNMSGTQALTGNTATSTVGGGAIYSTGTLNLTNVPVTSNRASNNGGGITITGGTATLTNILFDNNSAGAAGGGLYVSGGTITLNDNTFTNNKAGYNIASSTYGGGTGGGISLNGGSLTLKGNTLVENNNAGDGAGIYRAGSSTNLLFGSPVNVTINNNGKQYCNQGGGLFLASSVTPLLLTADQKLSITNNASTSNAGGIYADSAPLNFDGVRILNNQTNGNGGGIYAAGVVSGQASVRVVNSVLRFNRTGNASNGGAIDATNGTLTLSNDSITDNRANRGGGIYAMNSLVLQNQVVFERDTANTDGGAIYKAATSGTFDAGSLTTFIIRNNVATSGSGGGIYTLAPLTLSASNGASIESNKSGSHGGAIYANDALNLSYLSILSNSAGGSGGGVYKNDGGTLSLKSNTFAHNTAVSNGGALAMTVNANGTILNNTFSDNRATGNGGAIYIAGNPSSSSLKIAFSTFNGNISTANNGHALYLGTQGNNRVINGNIIYGNGSSGTEISSSGPLSASSNIVRDTSPLPVAGGNKNVPSGLASQIFTTISAGDVASLENNGGPTQTLNIVQRGFAHNFVSTSAVNTWTGDFGIIDKDQRDQTRVFGCKYDAGSVELQVPDDPSTHQVKAAKLCQNGLVNLDTLVVATVNVIDTLYFSDANYTIPLNNPLFVDHPQKIYVKFITTSNCEDLDSIQLNMYPLRSTWINTSNNADWNDPGNWDAGIPGPCTYVVIPPAKAHYPILTQAMNAVCDTIEFQYGGEVAKTNYLGYNFAKVDLTLAPNQWHLLAPPLQQLFSGDYFDNSSINRKEPEIYIMYYQTGNPEIGTPRVEAKFTGFFNNTDELLSLCTGQAVWVDNGSRPDPDFTIHWPKDSAQYWYYQDGKPVSQSGVMPRDKRGRFIYEGNASYQTNGDGSFSQNIANSDAGYHQLIIGNPYLSHLDVAALQAANSSYLLPSYRVWNRNTYDTYLISPDGTGTISTADLATLAPVAPMQSFIMDVTGPFTSPILFTPDMSVTQALGTIVQTPDVLKIEIQKEGIRQSGIAIRYKEGESNNFNPLKDAWTTFLRTYSDHVTLYTLVDGGAASIHTTGDIETPMDLDLLLGKSVVQEIKAGIRKTYTLRTSGNTTQLNGKDLFLWDTEKNTVHNLSQSPYNFEITDTLGYIDRRFKLSALNPTGIEEFTDGNLTITAQQGNIKISSAPSDPIKSVKVYSAQGLEIYKAIDLNTPDWSFSISSQSQVVIIQVETLKNSKTKKMILQ